MDEGDGETEYEDWSRFTYEDCTCPHDPDQHTWGECGQAGCPCTAGWEE